MIIYFRPELKPIIKEAEVVLRLPETEPLSPPILQLNEVLFRYNKDRVIFSNVNIGATMESRICIVSICCTLENTITQSFSADCVIHFGTKVHLYMCKNAVEIKL